MKRYIKVFEHFVLESSAILKNTADTFAAKSGINITFIETTIDGEGGCYYGFGDGEMFDQYDLDIEEQGYKVYMFVFKNNKVAFGFDANPIVIKGQKVEMVDIDSIDPMENIYKLTDVLKVKDLRQKLADAIK